MSHGEYEDVSPSVPDDGGYSNTPPDYPPIKYETSIDGGIFELLTGRYLGDWVTGTKYQPGDMVADSNRNLILCLTLHTSAGLVDDTVLLYWGYLFNLSGIELAQLPIGGSTNQILEKVSGASFDTAWADPVVGLSDAPSDGSAYGRKDGGWLTLPEIGHTHAAAVITFDPFPIGMSAVDVQAALEEMDGRLDTHAALSNIHYTDALSDGQEYVRLNGAWAVNTGGSGGIGEAPIDGSEYVRKNAAWVVGSGGIAEAPIDGSPYIRINGGWSLGVDVAHGHAAAGITFSNGASGLLAVEVQAALDEIDGNLDTHIASFHIAEAPIDTKLYARQDAGWAEVSGITHIHSALQTTFNPATSSLTGTDVQAVIDQEDAKVEAHIASFHMPEAPNDGEEYVRRNLAWTVATGGGGGAQVTVNATAPVSPAIGDLWIHPDFLDMKVWYDDGDSTQWVPTANAVLSAAAGVVHIGPTAPVSPTIGQIWIRDTDLVMWVWYDDGDSEQWVPPSFATGGYVPEAASDGNIYGRKNQTWVGAAAAVHTHSEADITDLQDYPLISAVDELAGKMELATVAVLPGTPDVNTIYFVTT